MQDSTANQAPTETRDAIFNAGFHTVCVNFVTADFAKKGGGFENQT